MSKESSIRDDIEKTSDENVTPKFKGNKFINIYNK